MSGTPPDAKAFPPPHGVTPIPPRHREVWIRLAGAWHAGELGQWFPTGNPDQPGYLAWIQHPHPDGHPGSTAGFYRYEASIQPRLSSTPPDRWRTTCTWDEAEATQYRPLGQRGPGQLVACPGCDAEAKVAAMNRAEAVITFLPCGHQLNIAG